MRIQIHVVISKKLFNLIIIHGHVQVDFKLGVIIPVIKYKRKG